jgi:hypothetical protein
MKQTLSVKNWDEFQHYKDRNPPWIKLHNTLLEDYDFECLQDASKGHLLCIWMLASRTGNQIPNDAAWIGRKIGASSPVDIDELLSSGFLVLNQPLQEEEQAASKPLADCEQDAIPEQSRAEGETEGEESTADGHLSVNRLFDEFYDKYPKKVDKQKAKQKFVLLFKTKTADQTRVLLDRIITNIDQRIASGEWDLSNKTFITGPATYLLNKKWEDEVIGAPHGPYQQAPDKSQKRQVITESVMDIHNTNW